jgi:formylglycine-generating enzyme required for sulfatase activity
MVAGRLLWGCGLAGTLAACSNTAAPRPQVVLYIDTDAPVVGQLVDPAFSADAAIDTVRIDDLDDSGAQDPCEGVFQVVVPDPGVWPVSLGIPAPVDGSGGTRHLWIRLFRGQRALPDACGASIPPPSITLGRLVDVGLPTAGIVNVRILLASDCRGVLSSFSEGTTCIDAEHLDAPASTGIEALTTLPTQGSGMVGTWPPARELPCPTTPAPTAAKICVPGGFSILGDDRVDFDVISDLAPVPSLPLLPVRVSSFLMDKTEFTVGRFNDLIAAMGVAAVDASLHLQNPADSSRCGCTWLGTAAHSNDALPLNCLSWDTARRICELEGGRLPTQAEWEHAARGRGQGLTFPWGDDQPECCRMSWGRWWTTGCLVMDPTTPCTGPGIQPAGSPPGDVAACAGQVNSSRDGILDLAGNLSEATLDRLTSYSDECWTQGRVGGIPVDPVCDTDGGEAHVAHGGDWSSGYLFATGAAREGWLGLSPLQGFRCVYPESP